MNKTENDLHGWSRRQRAHGIGLDLTAGLLIAWSGVVFGLAQTPTVAPDHLIYYPGEDITFTFRDGPGNAKDWIGIYPEGVEPGAQPSTLWWYVDNTQAGATGLKEGAVTFAGGLNLAGTWYAYLCLDDGYTKLAQTSFTVVDPFWPLVRADQKLYAIGETITVTFTNGPANPRDWIGLYPEGVTPGPVPSLLWSYTDSAGGSSGKADGAVAFANGLTQAGNYQVFFLENDGYTVLATDTFAVFDPSAAKVRVLSQFPADNATNVLPVVSFRFAITNGVSKVVAGSIVLKVDGAAVSHSVAQQGELTTVTFTNSAPYAPGSSHTFTLTFADNATPPVSYTHPGAFTVAVYQNIVLPAPIVFENFDSTSEGGLPAGWTEKSYTDVQNPELDLGNLDSASYATWTTVAADRFRGLFVTYSNPDGPQAEQEDYQRVLSVNPRNVVDGRLYEEPLAKGRFLFGNSGYRNGRSQVLYLFTPEYNLTGKQDIFVSFHSLWEQNQDSIAAVEYSIDGGQTWLPVVYMLDGPDVVRDLASGAIDAQATMATPRGDVAVYTDPDSGEDRGGYYGAFLGVESNRWSTLGPFISPRVNDDPVESKRVELFRLPAADHQAKVHLRFAHAGTDSWYFGIDDFGLYSISAVTPPKIETDLVGATVTAGEGATLSVTVSGAGPFTYEWFHDNQPVSGVTGSALSLAAAKLSDAGQYYVRVSNAAGGVTSATVTLTVNPRPPAVSGAWDFDQGDLAITAGVGTLEYADGAGTQALTAFETTDGTTVPHINGQPAKFMRVPAFTAPANGYTLTMPTLPNGGGGYVNRYTMVFDILSPGSINWTPLFNTNPGNGNDADFYVSDAGALGIGALGYSAGGLIGPDTWYRIAFAADLGAGQVSYYVNGQPVRVRTGGSLLDGRFALYSGNDGGPDILLFNEPSGSYTHEVLVNSFMFTDRRMSAEELWALGGPSAAGIPADISAAPLRLAVSLLGGSVVLSWSGGAGPYQVQKTATLTNPSWQNVGAPTTDTTLTEPTSGNAAFYRVAGQ